MHSYTKICVFRRITGKWAFDDYYYCHYYPNAFAYIELVGKLKQNVLFEAYQQKFAQDGFGKVKKHVRRACVLWQADLCP